MGTEINKSIHVSIKKTLPTTRQTVERFLDAYEKGQITSFGIVYFDSKQQMAFWNWFGVTPVVMEALTKFKNTLNEYLQKATGLLS